MAQYIPKSALVAEIERRLEELNPKKGEFMGRPLRSVNPKTFPRESELEKLLFFIDTLEVKEVDEQKERMSECPYRQVGCKMYDGYILECKGACNWVVDYLKLKELKAQKGK